jgi:hypothetical protein
VDDNLVAGTKKSIKKLMKQIKGSELTVTIEHELKYYLSFKIQIDRDTRSTWLGQTHMVKKIIKEFGEEATKHPSCSTARSPGMGIV